MSRILCWNARGVGNKGTTSHLKALCVLHNPDILMIIEPKIPHSRLPVLGRQLNMAHHAHCHDVNNHMWLLWQDTVDISDLDWGSHQVTSTVTIISSQVQSIYSFVHAPCLADDRQVLWDVIVDRYADTNLPWLIAGDFNAISSSDEKQGGIGYDSGSTLSFNHFQMHAGVLDAGFKGNKFTWSNNQAGDNRIWERLDRVLLSGPMLAAFPDIQVTHLPRVHSDHCPLLVELSPRPARKGFFQFQKCWIEHPSFMNEVRSAWTGSLHRNPMVNLGLKLKRTRSRLRLWNWNVFGNTSLKMRNILTDIEAAEALLQRDWSDDLAMTVSSMKTEYEELKRVHCDLLASKAGLAWMKDGDRNSKFFHSVIRARRAQNKVQIRLSDGSLSDNRDDIGNAAVRFYTDLFSGYTPPADMALFEDYRPMIDDDTNAGLSLIPDEREIHEAIIDMNADSAPGPDGFTGHFYRSCWSIIKQDLVAAIRSFFRGQVIPTSMAATQLILIPKVSNATDISQLRPISLCNFSHKIISHILTARLAPLLPRLICEEQSGFIKGRAMHDNIALAHDLAFDLENKRGGDNMIIKLDMSKAYDRISWSFIIRALRSLGFSESWCDLIFRCISNCRYSVKWDSNLYGFFRSTQGVRQGDPLSPSLFVLAMDWLSKAINKGVRDGGLMPFYTAHNAIKISHLLFADDILIFSNGSNDSLSVLLDIIKDFCGASGQQLNPDKSLIIFPEHISPVRKQDIIRSSGFKEGSLPLTYLGAPLYRGRTRLEFFSFLAEKLISKTRGWARSYLSMGARVTLVNAVLNSMAIHAMMVLPVPSGVLDKLISIMANFIWDSGSNRRRHWVGWERLCCPREAGGLGIRHPRHILLSLHSKLAWSYVFGNSLWSRYAKSRFREGRRGSPIWNSISLLIASMRSEGSWKIGMGSVKCKEIFAQLGLIAPGCISRERISDVLTNPGQRFTLMHNLPAAVAHDLSTCVFSDQVDVFSWRGSSDGTFSTKSCFDSFQTRYGSIGWGSKIWNAWIPSKISCFVWKVFHNIVPTDDNILRFGIALASKCTCCLLPDQESSQHLLFQGDWARRIWSYLGSLFDRPQPRSLGGFRHSWLSIGSTDFIDNLASALACIALWEVWKSRNFARHESLQRDSLVTTLNWAPRIAKLLKSSYKASFQNDLILHSLRIHIPSSRGSSQSVIQPHASPSQFAAPDSRPHANQSRPLASADDQHLPRQSRYRYIRPSDDSSL